jgi:WD40 repeat protein
VFTGAKGSRLVPYEQLTNETSQWERTIDGLNGASPDQRWLGIFREYHGFLDIHRLPGLEHVARLTHNAAIGRFEYSPNGDEVAVASPAGIAFWSTSTWQPTRRLTNFADIHYSPDGRTFWLASGLRAASLYDARTVEAILPLPAGALPLALSADGRYLAVSVDLRRVQLWDLLEVRARLRELGLDWREPGAEASQAKL